LPAAGTLFLLSFFPFFLLKNSFLGKVFGKRGKQKNKFLTLLNHLKNENSRKKCKRSTRYSSKKQPNSKPS